jgi:peptidoglycan/LPS O-acetylase OafA/YrhL
MTHLKYRADIDGMRAVAVLGVIIYHAFPHALPGGFIGVDIFFVISGYLISGILYKGHREGNFSFAEFYARRIRRLFPSLIAVLAICLVYGAVVLLPNEYQQLGKHVAAGTLFIQNIVFWQESGYFDTAANLKPLLHLWSLAVEEQYYIFFPPLLLLVWKRKWPLVLILSILLVASMIGNLVMSVQNRASDFFLTPYRAWEFLAGSLLAWWHFDRGPQSRDGEEVPRYRHALSLGGVVILGLGMAFIHKGDPYPGWRALAPVAGTLLIIQAGRSAWVNRCLLSHPALVWIGLISYPLYLFHWPALSFVHIVKGGKSDNITIWSALAVAFALTAITYYFIERPIRYSRSKRTIPSLVAAFVMLGIVGMCFGTGAMKLKVNSKMALIDQAIAEKSRPWGEGFQTIWSQGQTYITKTGGDGLCTLFFGDSNVQQYGPRIIELIKDNHGPSRGAVFLTCGGIPPIPGLTSEEREDCTEFISKLKYVSDTYPKIDRVVIAALWNGYFIDDSKFSCNGASLGQTKGRQSALDRIGGMIKSLVSSGKKVTFLLVPPNGPELDPRLSYGRDFLGRSVLLAKNLTTRDFQQRHQELLTELKRVAELNGAEVIDPVAYLSTKRICIRENSNGPIRYDGCHLRPSYVRDHVKYLDSSVAP